MTDFMKEQLIWKVYGYRSPENKWYVGQTYNSLLGRSGTNGDAYRRAGGPFGKAIEEFGWDAMEQNVLRLCSSQEEADYWEKFYVNEKRSLYPDGYNVRVPGKNDCSPFGGYRCLKEHDEIPEHTRGQSLAVDVWYNPPKSPNHYWVGTFTSLSKAAKECGVSPSMASLALRGKRFSCKGYEIYPHKENRNEKETC